MSLQGINWRNNEMVSRKDVVSRTAHIELGAHAIHVWLAAVVIMALALSVPALGQNAQVPQPETQAPQPETGTIVGTVTDVNGDTVPNATAVLQGPGANDRVTVTTNEEGFFEFRGLKPNVNYQVKVSAAGLADWTSPVVILDPEQYKILTDIELQVPMERTTVDVTMTPEEVATEEVHIEEQQRVFGVIPNFYVVYDQNAVPLTPKLKFKLAFKVSSDPITAVGIAFLSATQQAGDTPDFGQGWDAFGKRFGANAADGFTDIMIGGAILPSLLHQDPRYFYQGTGTTKSRMLHAMKNPFVCKGDNGKWQPNFSSLGGDLASSAISNLYYPKSNRGVGLVFGNFAIGEAERIASSLAQEFLLGRLTHRGNSK
jgi:hypothetical protein